MWWIALLLRLGVGFECSISWLMRGRIRDTDDECSVLIIIVTSLKGLSSEHSVSIMPISMPLCTRMRSLSWKYTMQGVRLFRISVACLCNYFLNNIATLKPFYKHMQVTNRYARHHHWSQKLCHSVADNQLSPSQWIAEMYVVNNVWEKVKAATNLQLGEHSIHICMKCQISASHVIAWIPTCLHVQDELQIRFTTAFQHFLSVK